MGNTTKRIAEVQPGKTKISIETLSIGNQRLENESVFIAAFGRTGTLLGRRHEVIGYGIRHQTIGQNTHEEFVDATHQGNGTKVGHVIGGTFLVDEDCG